MSDLREIALKVSGLATQHEATIQARPECVAVDAEIAQALRDANHGHLLMPMPGFRNCWRVNVEQLLSAAGL